MAASTPFLFTARHIDRLPRPVFKALTATVLLLHGILIVLALRSVPLVDAGDNGGGGGSGSPALYVSVLQGQPSSAVSRSPSFPAPAEKAAPVKNKSQSGLIATASSSKRTTQAVRTVEKKAEKLPQTPASSQQVTNSTSATTPATGAGKHPANGSGNGTGDGNSPGSGQGESTGNRFGTGGSGSGPARSVSLSQLRYKHAFKPEYPARSIQRHESGQVAIQVVVDTAGRVHDARVISSSGFDRLDESALKAARRSTFYPYMEHGRAIFAKAVIPYRFNLNKK